MKKSSIGVILLAILLLVGLLPSCQTKARVDAINAETIELVKEHNAQTGAIIAGKVDKWILDQQAAGVFPTTFEIALKRDEISKVEYAAAAEREAEIFLDGAKRAKEAGNGLWAELAINAPGAIAAVAAGNPIGGLLLLLGAAGIGGGGAYVAAKKNTVKVASKVAQEVDEKRSADYGPGRQFEGLPLLAANTELLMKMAHEHAEKDPDPMVKAQFLAKSHPLAPPAGFVDDRGKAIRGA